MKNLSVSIITEEESNEYKCLMFQVHLFVKESKIKL